MARKKYSITIEEDEVVSVEINGKKYQAADEIADPEDQARMVRMVQAAMDLYEDFETGTSNSLGKVIFPVFLSVAALMLIIAVVAGVYSARRVASEQSAEGRVVSLAAQRGSEGTVFYYPVVAFTLPDERISTVQISEGSAPPAYEVGQQVTVLYNPDHPNQARIKSIGSALGVWTLTIITGILAAAFLAASGFAYWLLKPEKRKQAQTTV